MALVDYGNSDSSDFEDEEVHKNNGIRSLSDITDEPSFAVLDNSSSVLETTDDPVKTDLFKTIPKPSRTIISAEEDDEFLHKKENEKKTKAKIAIPSLSDFKDLEDRPSLKKSITANGKKSGLLSILPEPKFSGSSMKKAIKPLIPNVVKQNIINIAPNPPPNGPEPATASKSTENKNKSFLHTTYSDSDEDDEKEKPYAEDFFSIHSQEADPGLKESITEPNIEYPLTDNTAANEMVEQNKYMYQAEIEQANINVEPHVMRVLDTTSSNDLELDDEAIRQLCGSRKRHKKEDIQFITVDQQQVLSDSREWLVKGLMDDTTKRVSSSKRKGNEPTSQQKRKHQITYLAHQAKANEAELQNQWASNRMSKRQTQSKYGF